MDSKEVSLLKKALERQKKARRQAEMILEEKSQELYDTSRQLKETNARLENLLSEKTSELEGVFINIVDPYLVMDINGQVIRMNAAAKQLLGYDHTKESINLSQLVHPEFLEYTKESFKKLYEVGTLKNYRAKIVVKDKSVRFVQVNSSLIYDKDRNPIAAQGIIRDITKESEVEALLSEQKKQLDIIVENSPLGIVLTVNSKFIRANKAFANLLGYSESELKEVTVNAISDPEDEEVSQELHEKMIQGKLENYSVIKRFIKKSGDTLTTKTSVSAVRDPEGKIAYEVAIVEDITKEKEAEEQIKASENRLATLISNLQTGVLLENEDRKISLTNQMFCDLFEIPVSPEQLKGADCSNAAEESKHHFKDPKAFVKRIDEILKSRKLVLSDELEMKDGRILERDYIPIFNNGVYKGHLWTYNDVTIRKNYKTNLENQKEKYWSIIANMNLGLIEVDNKDVIQLVNQSFCKMSGYSEKELLGQKASEILKVHEKNLIEEKGKERLKGKSDSYEVKVVIKSGQTNHWLLSGAPRYDETGKVVGSIGIHLDITTQKNLELQKEELLAELEESNKGLQEYAHIVSHDLKSPLRSISTLATWLHDDYIDLLDETGVYNLQMMQEKVEGMDKLIDGILKYSSIKSETLEKKPVDLNQVVNDIREIIFIPEHVSVIIMDPLPTLQADATKMHQLFQNLISNAVINIDKSEGIVSIGVTEKKDIWEFYVRDNGVGIPKEYHDKIFKIFQSIGSEERSTGIGLSIVKKIVDLYQGEIWLNSKVGEGTTFYFTLNK
ncbi:MAG: PAS domain S-box protein [Flavobacteriaceae bacterium]|nr:PAS domain S-box protein [Muriicola sp.]NNC61618.1 PAS domain S-box protein [Eudoraea sp.]NNK20817.1 PAS domain S-box protein [Flavobacteriaceae bacterium]MBT8289749.1 PAS domain S-box protein [Muriicola sp.]NNK34940.1 PAS domain S-box protein [Eudoraea sp.]